MDKLPKMSKALLGSKLPKIKISQKPTYKQSLQTGLSKPVYKKLATDVDFFKLFEKIEASFRICFIFESLGEEGRLSRYSIIGFDPKHIISAKRDTLFVDKKQYEVKNPYFALRHIMPEQTISRNYAGGLVGYLSYSAANYFDSAIKVKEHKDFGQFMFGVYTDGLILDKTTGELFYFYHNQDRSQLLKKIMNSPSTRSARSGPKVKFLGDTLTKEEHKKIVLEVKEKIKAGLIFQCEVGFKSKFKILGDTLKIYQKLRKVNPSPFMYYLKFGQKKVIGASPELLFSLRDGEMITAPLAGTIRRGKNETEDQKLARKLLSDPKERAEHNMLVDLHRNDMGKVAQFGTVKVRDLMSTKRFSHVTHISSEIVGIIKRGEDSFSALASNFPAGTLTGTPKIEAMKIIDQNEQEPRGVYGGAVGTFDFNGDCIFAIAIRSLFISGENAYTQTSGGIVYDSEPNKEYKEIENKLRAMKKVLV